MTYSIAYGVIAGLVSYMVINGADWLLTAISVGAHQLPALMRHTFRKVSSLPVQTSPDISRFNSRTCSGCNRQQPFQTSLLALRPCMQTVAC